ncbi:MAG TPA: hypothetical protein VIF62_24320, partial [Labilithrix sp.]
VIALHAWLQEWSETARTVLTKRDQLIRLGLAKRRRKPSEDTVTPAAPPVATGPAAANTVQPNAAASTASAPIETAPDSRAA